MYFVVPRAPLERTSCEVRYAEVGSIASAGRIEVEKDTDNSKRPVCIIDRINSDLSFGASYTRNSYIVKSLLGVRGNAWRKDNFTFIRHHAFIKTVEESISLVRHAFVGKNQNLRMRSELDSGGFSKIQVGSSQRPLQLLDAFLLLGIGPRGCASPPKRSLGSRFHFILLAVIKIGSDLVLAASFSNVAALQTFQHNLPLLFRGSLHSRLS